MCDVEHNIGVLHQWDLHDRMRIDKVKSVEVFYIVATPFVLPILLVPDLLLLIDGSLF